MAYDEKLAARVRAVLADRDDVEEIRMFGGLCFMVGGAMCCGLTRDDFMVKVGPAALESALREPHARVMDFTGRPSRGMVYVGAEGLRTPAMLAAWVRRGLDFLASEPAPAKKKKRPAARRRASAK